jgi:PKHD-type hydroxylase
MAAQLFPMLLTIADLLNPEQVAKARTTLEGADWVDGRVTAGPQSAQAKDNSQIPEGHPAAREVGGVILDMLGRNPLFLAATLPLRVFPPLFNRYSGGQSFGTHVDNAIRPVPGTPHRVRTDLSATLFLSGPEEYDGGELTVQDTYGSHNIKLRPGSLVLYPASSLHHVTPVTRGTRLCSFFWIQSMIRDDGQRSILFDLDIGIQRINRETPGHPSLVPFTGVYHNLLRQWAEV